MSDKYTTGEKLGTGVIPAIVEPPRMESTVASEYRLVKRQHLVQSNVGGGAGNVRVEYDYVLQGKFNWTKGFAGGFEWRDIATVEE